MTTNESSAAPQREFEDRAEHRAPANHPVGGREPTDTDNEGRSEDRLEETHHDLASRENATGSETLGKFRQDNIKRLTAEIAADPENPDLRSSRAFDYLAEGQFDLAFEDFAAAEKQKPLLAQAHFFRGKAHLRIGQYERAVPDLETAFEKQCMQERCLAMLAYASFGLGNYELAAARVAQCCSKHLAKNISPDFVAGLAECQESDKEIPAEDRHAMIIAALDGSWRTPIADTDTPCLDESGTPRAAEGVVDYADFEFPFCPTETAFKWTCGDCGRRNPGAMLRIDRGAVAVAGKDPVFAAHYGLPAEDIEECLMLPPFSVCPHCENRVRFWQTSSEAKAEAEKIRAAKKAAKAST